MDRELNEEKIDLIDVPYNTGGHRLGYVIREGSANRRRSCFKLFSPANSFRIPPTPRFLDLTKKIEALTSQTFEAARYQFFAYNKKAIMGILSRQVSRQGILVVQLITSHGIIFDKLGVVVQHSVFKDVLNIIVNKVKHGIPSNTKVYNPDMTGEDILGGVRSLLMNHAVKEKVVEVQKASRNIGNVHKIVVNVEKLPGKILDGAYHDFPPNIESLGEITFSGYSANKKEGERQEQKTIDFDNVDQAGLKDGKWDVVFITLGTTRGAAGSAEAFERIDREYVLNAARAARTHDPNHFQRVVQAGRTLPLLSYTQSTVNFYFRLHMHAEALKRNSSNRSKGLTELGLAKLGYKSA
ncbi:hypothetical protein JOM56_012869 [Amanita muscaria]